MRDGSVNSHGAGIVLVLVVVLVLEGLLCRRGLKCRALTLRTCDASIAAEQVEDEDDDEYEDD